MEQEWGLHAVVRGCSNDGSATIDELGVVDFDKEYDQALRFAFPDLFETAAVVKNELDDFYKPFYPSAEVFPASSSSDVTNSSSSSSFDANVLKEVKEEGEEKAMPLCGSTSFVSDLTRPLSSKHKRRKNQLKKVVVRVNQEGLNSDMWGWRKYGQKPIKGSPYPRSYYRCSTSKLCVARRQVEQSYTDPGIYILTYTGEHNHAKPTRRNSLAGINRQKFGAPKGTSISKSNNAVSNDHSSPTTTMVTSSTEEVHQQPIKQEKLHSEDEPMMAESDFTVPEMNFSYDFFTGLEDLEGWTSDYPSSYGCSSRQFPVSFNSSCS